MAKQDYNEDPLLGASVVMKDKRLNTLMSYYKAATKQLTSELVKATDFGRDRRLSILHNIDSILQKLDTNTYKWFKTEVEDYYKTYGAGAIEKLAADGFPVNSSFSLIDQEAVSSMTDGIMGYYREAYSGVKRSAMKMLDEAARSQVNILLSAGRITGDDRRTIADKIAGKLSQGFISLVDKGGREWSLESYSNMVTRTMLVRTANEGVKNRLAQNGDDLVQVSEHASACDQCGDWEGKILSMSGGNPDYDSVSEAEDDGLFHPNCRHRLLPYHETLAEVSTIWDAESQEYINL